jgi:uncharacterized membrane protein
MIPKNRLSNPIFRLSCAFLMMLFLSSAIADDFSVNSGLSAHWYNPERDGEGLVLEVLSEDSALVYWFTYDEQGNQRWLISLGEIDGNKILFPELLVTRGGRFGADFDPDEVEREVVGWARLSFSDCDSGEFNYEAFGQGQTISMVRLSQTMAAGCQPLHGVPGEPVRDYAGQSGSWFDPSHDGEGYTLQWMSRDEAIVVWFSYAPDGNQYWMIGIGQRVEDQIRFEMMHSARGGRFGEDFDSAEVELIEWGSLFLELECLNGSADYESLHPDFGAGSFALERLSILAQPNCPWMPPKLSDIYAIDLVTVSESTTPTYADDITNDGLIIGRYGSSDAGGFVARRTLDDSDWEILPGQQHGAGGSRPRISLDGSTIVAGTRTSDGMLHATVLWDAEQGWRELSETVFERYVYRAASRDLTRVVGTGRNAGTHAQSPWIWDAQSGQVELPLTEEITNFYPNGAASDGETVIGIMIRPWPGGPIDRRDAAVRWVKGGELHHIHDEFGYELGYAKDCNADCSVVVGMDQAEHDPDHPHFRQAWIWRKDGQVTYMSAPANAISNSTIPPATPLAISADGTIVVGVALLDLGNRGFIWTQNTGLITFPELFDEIGLGDSNWRHMSATAISPDGSKILIHGYQTSSFAPTVHRVKVLTLTSKM